ncbi:MAG: hypothetical protein CVV41_05080 [Candidatus Riflebacteria bacterium HGW-Riflebacteria-1]|nr:MAG: hypothetical protein CVV41_05080 [Candidatus Riflebacteria bacterium HGW-Riflebacteria-1]
MKEKYAMFKFIFASLACCLLAAAMITGCGGSNPSGPGSETAVDPAAPASESLVAKTYTMIGRVIVDENIAVGSITVKLLKQDYVSGLVSDTGKASITLSSGEFSFTNLSTGTYVLKVEDSADYLESSKLAIINTSNDSSLNTGNMQLYAKSSGASISGQYSLTGKIVNSDNAPVSGINVKLFMQDLTTNTVVDTGKTSISLTSGEFNFNSLAVGIYVLKTEVNAFYKESSKLAVVSASTQPIVNSGNLLLVSQVDNKPTTGQTALIGKVVAENSVPIGSVSVKLFIQDAATGNSIDTGRTSVTLTSGEFNFNSLSTGTYILKVAETTKYLESSKLAMIANSEQTIVDTGFLQLSTKAVLNPTIATLDLKGRIISSLSNTYVSAALVTLDSGQNTVTNGFGEFSLKNIEAGSRKITVEQPGLAPFTISFEVIGVTAPDAESIVINNVTYAVNEGPRTVNLITAGYDIQVNPQLHHSGTLMGTVKKYKVVNGAITPELEIYSGYEFALWQVFPDSTAKTFCSVMSKADGTWRVDQLPPEEDNGAKWFAVPKNTIISIKETANGNILSFESTDPVWVGRDAVLAYGYVVKAGETTIMDITVPTFVTAPTISTVTPISDAVFASAVGGPYSQDITVSLMDDLYARWTDTGTSTLATLYFRRAYLDATTPSISKNFTISNVAGTVENFKFKPVDLGLDYGRYTWKILSNDPAIPSKWIESDSSLITIRPSNVEVTPREGTTIKIQAAAYVYKFKAPVDPEATTYSFELFQGTVAGGGVLVANAIGTSPEFDVTFAAGILAVDDYYWQVTYSYTDGPPMRTQEAAINFVN